MKVTKAGVRVAEGFEPPKYLSSLIAAINDGAKAAQSGALAWALVGVYLLATAFSVSDEDLLRGRAVTISQISATLPVGFSFAIAPFVFVFLHIYTLARYDMLSANVMQWLSELRRTVKSEADQERCRQLLANVEFVQALVAPRASRLYSWVWPWLVCVIIAVFPVLVLLVVQINSLRYQSSSILGCQRVSLAIDLLALVWFFYRNPLKGPESRFRQWVGPLQQRGVIFGRFDYRIEAEQSEGTTGRSRPSRRRLAVLACGPLLIAGINLAYFNVVPPGADPYAVRYDQNADRSIISPPIRHYYPDNPLIHYTVAAFSLSNPFDIIFCADLDWGCRYLDVRHRDLVSHVSDDKAIIALSSGGADKAKALAEIDGLVLPGRSFRFAMLNGSSLVAANLAGADLRGASLEGASLLSTTLSGAHLQGANLDGAQLQGAYLNFADLQGATFRFTQLQGANLAGAYLPGTSLAGAPLQGADLSDAWLQCADLRGAQLQGANFRDAHLQGVDLGSAQLQGADLRGAQLYGAAFGSVKGDPNVLPKTNLYLSDLRNVDTDKLLEADEAKQISAAIETVPDKARAECLKRLVRQSSYGSRALLHTDLKTLLRETVGNPMLAGTPIPSYTTSLVEFLDEGLAASDFAIAGAIARRVLANLGDADYDQAPIGCQLLADVRADKVKLDPQTALFLSSQLQLRGINCKLNQPPSSTGANR